MIIINTYNPRWPEEFERIKSSLQAILGEWALRIDHIGSTSVPGLGAKDIIDIQVTVKELDSRVKEILVKAGYQDWPGFARDHVPQGENPDPKRWEKFFFNPPEGQRPANIHIRVAGNPNQRYPLLFRDYLRAHPKSAKSIELIKREIAKRHANDLEAYYDIKDPVYDLIWEAAMEWSRSTAWSADRMNEELLPLDRHSIEIAVREVFEAGCAAWNRGDLDGYLAGYWDSEKTIWISSGTLTRGRDAIVAACKARFSTPAQMGRLAIANLEIDVLTDVDAMAFGRWSLEMENQTSTGFFTVQLRKVEGAWVYVADHSSTQSIS